MKAKRLLTMGWVTLLVCVVHVGSGHAANSLDAADGTPAQALYVDNDGRVGIGTTTPIEKLHVYSGSGQAVARIEGSSNGINGGILEIGDHTSGDVWHIPIRTERDQNLEFYVWDHLVGGYRGPWLAIQKDGDIGIGTATPQAKLDVVGRLRISDSSGGTVLEMGEGLDYAEGFDVSAGTKAAPGSVLVIDPANPGKLKLSDCAYDKKVAGIAAGAKGLGSAVRLGVGQFDCDVALAGRVYCNVDARTDAIEPGDPLTTADVPGYAMKAADHARATGAILGKAMEPLAKDQKGQILVLVTLQ